MAVRNGDTHKHTMEMADYWLLVRAVNCIETLLFVIDIVTEKLNMVMVQGGSLLNISINYYVCFVIPELFAPGFASQSCLHRQSWKNIYDLVNSNLVPKGVQEKMTEVLLLENKVDRMWVSNAFF